MGNEGKSIKLYDSLQGTWDKSDRQNYQNAFWRKFTPGGPLVADACKHNGCCINLK